MALCPTRHLWTVGLAISVAQLIMIDLYNTLGFLVILQVFLLYIYINIKQEDLKNNQEAQGIVQINHY